jgi:hypothetical protein
MKRAFSYSDRARRQPRPLPNVGSEGRCPAHAAAAPKPVEAPSKTTHVSGSLRGLVLGCLGALLLAGAMAGCKKSQVEDTPKESGDPDFPSDYRQWTKVNAETIVREDEGVARELFAKAVGDLESGSVLVKEQFRLEGGTKGALELVAVMRRSGRGEAGGWEFSAFDPTTRQKVAHDATACVGCHTLQADSDYLFSERSALQP